MKKKALLLGIFLMPFFLNGCISNNSQPKKTISINSSKDNITTSSPKEATTTEITKKNMQNQTKGEKFKGKITEIHDGVAYDGTSYMIIDGKTVVFNQDTRQEYQEGKKIIKGNLIGFNESSFPYSKEMKNPYSDKEAEVFAEKNTYQTFEGGDKVIYVTEYSIFGSRDYYIKLLN